MCYIIIEDTKKGKILYHKGGNILFNTPTPDIKKAKTYKTITGAKNALNNVKKRIGGNLIAYLHLSSIN